MNWQGFFATLGGTALAVAALAWLAKGLTTHLLSKDLATFKLELDNKAREHHATLQHAADLELAKLKASLEVAGRERQLRFERLAEKQAEVVATVYARLERLHLASRRLVSPTTLPGDTRDDQRRKVTEAFREFSDYYYENAIWLDRGTCNSINAIVGELWAAFIDMTYDTDDSGMPRDREAVAVAYERVTKGIPEARRQLEEGFRALLGVERTVVVNSAARLPPGGETA